MSRKLGILLNLIIIFFAILGGIAVWKLAHSKEKYGKPKALKVREEGRWGAIDSILFKEDSMIIYRGNYFPIDSSDWVRHRPIYDSNHSDTVAFAYDSFKYIINENGEICDSIPTYNK